LKKGGETVTGSQSGARLRGETSAAGAPSLATISARAEAAAGRPVEAWDPPFCGSIDIRIDREGRWFYMETPIARPAMVALFASILRRETDGFHYLVTPVEKLRIAVDDAPFLAVEMRAEGRGGSQVVGFRTNLDGWILAGSNHPIRFVVDAATEGLKPYLGLDCGLEALLSRALIPDLVERAEQRVIDGRPMLGIASGGSFFPLPAARAAGDGI
jgi:uncharacterized protein